MKRQLDRLKGKRLVTGDVNLMTKDEICINTTPNGVEVKEIGPDGEIKDLAGGSNSSSGESVNEDIEFIYIKLNGIDFLQNTTYLITGFLPVLYRGKISISNTASTYQGINGMYMAKLYGLNLIGIAFLKIKEDGTKITAEDIINSNSAWSVCEEITKEEFYNLN